jgi:Transcriptional regulator PadR-like family
MPETPTPAVFHILLSLADQERHGYGIMQDVLERTNNQLRLGPGTLYGTIKRMLEAGQIEELPEREDENNQRRDEPRDENLSGVAETLSSRFPAGIQRGNDSSIPRKFEQ